MTTPHQPIIQAAILGGKVLTKYFGQNLATEQKSIASDFRTKADQESEQAILAELDKYYPNYNILAEESGSTNRNSEYTFVIDPLDGTNNFVLGIPYFSNTIALMQGDNIIFAVIHIPIINKTYWAEAGLGAFLDNKKLSVNKESNIQNATVSYGCSYALGQSEYTTNLIKKLNALKVKRTLSLWSPTIDFCLLAQGKIEAAITNETEIYDYIAGKLIMREAGAKISKFDGSKEENDKNDKFLATNGTSIHSKILNVLV